MRVAGLSGSHQISNAALAVNLVHQFLLSQRHRGPNGEPLSLYPSPLSDAVVKGLEKARWPGRCQEVTDPNRAGIVWFLDGAHTIESLTACTKWFFTPDTGFRHQPE